jgi:hypothetical protein
MLAGRTVCCLVTIKKALRRYTGRRDLLPDIIRAVTGPGH